MNKNTARTLDEFDDWNRRRDEVNERGKTQDVSREWDDIEMEGEYLLFKLAAAIRGEKFSVAWSNGDVTWEGWN